MKVMTKLSGRELYAKLLNGEQPDAEPYLTEDGEQIEPIEIIADLRQSLNDLAAMYGDHIPKGRDCEFDGHAAEIVHATLRGHEALVSNINFWIRLSLADLVRIVQLRHPGGTAGMAAPANFCLETPRNGFLFRSWLRGDIGFDPSFPDPYFLAKLGDDVDFWRSHVLRVDYGGCRLFARCFIRFVMDPTASYYQDLGRERMRNLAKIVNRRYATMPLNVLSEDEAIRLLNELVAGL